MSAAITRDDLGRCDSRLSADQNVRCQGDRGHSERFCTAKVGGVSYAWQKAELRSWGGGLFPFPLC